MFFPFFASQWCLQILQSEQQADTFAYLTEERSKKKYMRDNMVNEYQQRYLFEMNRKS